jgi:hypothetical protein
MMTQEQFAIATVQSIGRRDDLGIPRPDPEALIGRGFTCQRAAASAALRTVTNSFMTCPSGANFAPPAT